MSNITDTIRKQAYAIKNDQTKLDLADQFEALAKALRAGANEEKFSFKAIAGKDKLRSIEKFGKGISDFHLKDAKQALINAGFSCGFDNEKTGESWWGYKAKPGLQLKLSGGTFTVKYHDETRVSEASLGGLSVYLQKTKGGKF